MIRCFTVFVEEVEKNLFKLLQDKYICKYKTRLIKEIGDSIFRDFQWDFEMSNE